MTNKNILAILDAQNVRKSKPESRKAQGKSDITLKE